VTQQDQQSRATLRKELDFDYGVIDRNGNPLRARNTKLQKREGFSRATNQRLAYYKEKNPGYFVKGRVNADPNSIIELWEAVIWQAANDIRSADEKMEVVKERVKRKRYKWCKTDKENYLGAKLSKENAIQFFMSDNLDAICGMIGYDASYIRENMGKMEKRESNHYTRTQVVRVRKYAKQSISEAGAKAGLQGASTQEGLQQHVAKDQERKAKEASALRRVREAGKNH